MDQRKLSFGLFREIWMTVIKENPEIGNILQKFKMMGIDLYIAANTNIAHWDHVSKYNNLIRNYFPENNRIISCEIKSVNPEKKFLTQLLKKSHLHFDHLLCIHTNPGYLYYLTSHGGIHGIVYGSKKPKYISDEGDEATRFRIEHLKECLKSYNIFV